MTKLEIYNIALSQHGKKCTQTEIDTQTESEKPVEVEACDRMLDVAIDTALSEFDWSFSLVPLELDDEAEDPDVPYGKWEHGYAIDTSDFIRIANVETGTKDYVLAGDRLYTNDDDPELWCVSTDAKTLSTMPSGIGRLVGLYLAYLISAVLSPSDTNLAQRILQVYSGQLATLMKSEINSVKDSYLTEDDRMFYRSLV